MKRILALCFMVVLTIAAGEMLARLALWQPQTESDVGSIHYGYSPDSAGDHHPRQDGVYITAAVHRVRPFHVATNGDGFRNREELRGDGLRILALGDSQTFGLFANSQDVWTDWLEHYLRRDGVAVQVINNGLPGASIRDELDYFDEKGAKLGAHVVLLCTFLNDIADMGLPMPVRQEGMAMARAVAWSDLRWFLGHHSALYDAAKQIKDRLIQEGIKSRNRDRLAQAPQGETRAGPVLDPGQVVGDSAPHRAAYERDFIRLAERVKASGAKLVVAYLPGGNGGAANPRVRGFINDLAAGQGVAFIDLTAAIDARPSDELWLMRDGDPAYPADGHLSRTGHMVVAQALHQALTDRGLLTGSARP